VTADAPLGSDSFDSPDGRTYSELEGCPVVARFPDEDVPCVLSRGHKEDHDYAPADREVTAAAPAQAREALHEHVKAVITAGRDHGRDCAHCLNDAAAVMDLADAYAAAGQAGDASGPLALQLIIAAAALRDIKDAYDAGSQAHDAAHKALDDIGTPGFRQPQPAPGGLPKGHFEHLQAVAVNDNLRSQLRETREALSSLLGRTEGSDLLTDDERDEYRRFHRSPEPEQPAPRYHDGCEAVIAGLEASRRQLRAALRQAAGHAEPVDQDSELAIGRWLELAGGEEQPAPGPADPRPETMLQPVSFNDDTDEQPAPALAAPELREAMAETRQLRTALRTLASLWDAASDKDEETAQRPNRARLVLEERATTRRACAADIRKLAGPEDQ
jgi:hypothetical protein